MATQGLAQIRRHHLVNAVVVTALMVARAPVVHAHRQFMFATAQTKRTAQLRLAEQLLFVNVSVARIGQPGLLIIVGHQVIHVGRLPLIHCGDVQRALPAVTELVGQLGEGSQRVHVPIGPVLADAGATAAVMDQVAIGIDQRQAAPTAAVGVALVVRNTQRECVCVTQVESQHAAKDILLARITIEIGVAGFVGIDKAPAHITCVIQRTRHVDVDPTGVP